MICPKCGREIPDGTICPCSSGLLSSNPTLQVIKSIGSSPLFLAAVLLHTLSAVFSIIIAFNPSAAAVDVQRFLYDMGMDPELLQYVNGGTTSVVSVIASSIVTLLVTLALWLLYATCRNRQTGNISTGGLTILKVITMLGIIGLCIVALTLVASGIFLLIGSADESSLYGRGFAIIGAAFFVAALVFILMIFYQISLYRALSLVKKASLTGMPNNRVSGFLIVMLWIVGIFSIIGGLVELFFNPLSAVGTLCNAVFRIVAALIFQRLRQEMTMLMYPPVQPVYAQPAAPVQGYQAYGQPTAPQGSVPPAAPAQPAAPSQPPVAEPVQPVQPAEPSPQEKAPEQPEETDR